jgi:hypothetical protein
VAISVGESREKNQESEFMTKIFAVFFIAVFSGSVIESCAQEKQALRAEGGFSRTLRPRD